MFVSTQLMQVGYKCMRPRTNKRSAFATKCMVLAAYLTVNMGIGCVIAITTTWFWWVYMMMGILLFLLGVRIIIFGLSLTALLQFSRRHRRQRKKKAARVAARAVIAHGKSSSDLGSGLNLLQPLQQSQQQLLGGSSMTRQECDVSSLQQPRVQKQTVRRGWGSFPGVQTAAQGDQLVQQRQAAVPLACQCACLQSEWCEHSPV